MITESSPRAAQISPPPFPWRDAMAFGFGVLRLQADAFWSMTPRELASAVAGVNGRVNNSNTHTIMRPTLEALMRAFPDEASL